MKISARSYGRNPGRGVTDPRRLHLKLRVILTRAMTAETARLLLDQAVTTGIVPPGIRLEWLDWQKGDGGSARGGRLSPVRRAELRAFYGAMTQGETRFERVR